MDSTAITFDQLPHVVDGLSEKLDRVLELLEKVGIANPFNQLKPKLRIVYAKEACTIQVRKSNFLLGNTFSYEKSDFEYDFLVKY